MDDQIHGDDACRPGRIPALETEVARLTGLLARVEGDHPNDAQIEALGRQIAQNRTGDIYVFQSTGRLIDFVRELLTGEPHVEGYPLMSGLPNAPVSIRNKGDVP